MVWGSWPEWFVMISCPIILRHDGVVDRALGFFETSEIENRSRHVTSENLSAVSKLLTLTCLGGVLSLFTCIVAYYVA